MTATETAGFEAALRELPGVDDCAVVVLEHNPRLVARAVLDPSIDHGRLVAFVTGNRPPDLTEAAAVLADLMPTHLSLDEVIVTADLPRTADGGIDRARLAMNPLGERDGHRPHRPPETPEQRRVCAIWADVLGVDKIGLDDSFFAFGGDSLQALRIIARLRADTGSPLTVRDVLVNDTPRLLAALINRQAAQTTADAQPLTMPPAAVHTLSEHQAGLYFQWLLAPDSPYYSYQGTLQLFGPLDERRLRRAWRLLLAENPNLLARFADQDGQPVQHLPHWEIEIEPTVRGDGTAARFDRDARELAGRPFDLHTEPLLRAALYRFGDGHHQMLVTMHEILLDGWGAQVLFGRLGVLYAALADGENLAPDAQRRDAFAHYLHWQQAHLDGQEVQQAGRYWAANLAGTLPVLELPTDRPRPAFPSFRGGLIEQLLPGETTRRLHRRCAELGITPFTLILGAFALVLTYHAGADEVVIGAPMANRDTEHQLDVTGFLLNMLPFRIAVAPDMTVGEYLDCLRRTVLDGLAASDFPFSAMLRQLDNLPRSLDRAPVFQVMLNMLNYPVPAGRHDDIEFRFVEMDTGFTKYDCALYVQPHGDTGLLCQLAYQTDLFDNSTAIRWLAGVTAAVDALAGESGGLIGTIELLPPNENELLEHFSSGGSA